jgi:trk system potassium uptake protein
MLAPSIRAASPAKAGGAFDVRPIGYIVGWLVVALGALMALPILIDLVDRHDNAGAFAGSSLVAVVTGTSMVLACAGRRRAVLSQRQAFMLTTACWLALTGMATLPLMLGAPDLDFTDAFSRRCRR